MADLKSLFANLFLAVQGKIETDVPEIRWIDHDLGQLEDYEIRPSVAFPCVLIDFNETSYEQMQRNRQLGNITFTLRLGFPAFSATNNKAPQSVKEKGLQYYELEQLLYECIQDFDAGGLMQAATRISIVTEKRNDDTLRVRVMTFTSMTEDSSAMEKTTKNNRPALDLCGDVIESTNIGDCSVGEDFTVS